MKDYRKTNYDKRIAVRVPADLKKAVARLKLNASDICRDALKLAVQKK